MRKAIEAGVVMAGMLYALPAMAEVTPINEPGGGEVLACYHPSASYKSENAHVDIDGLLAAMLKSSKGAVRAGYIDIFYEGISGAKYKMSVGVDVKWDATKYPAKLWVRLPVLKDTARIPADPNCYMSDWTEQ